MRAIGVLCVAGALAAGPLLATAPITTPHEFVVHEGTEVPQFSDAEVAEIVKAMEAALEAGDGNRIRTAFTRNALIARGLKNNRALSDEQVEAMLSKLEGFKEAYPDHAAHIDRGIFNVSKLSIGRTAPNIKGIDTDEVEFELKDYLGKVVVIDFWGDW